MKTSRCEFVIEFIDIINTYLHWFFLNVGPQYFKKKNLFVSVFTNKHEHPGLEHFLSVGHTHFVPCRDRSVVVDCSSIASIYYIIISYFPTVLLSISYTNLIFTQRPRSALQLVNSSKRANRHAERGWCIILRLTLDRVNTLK